MLKRSPYIKIIIIAVMALLIPALSYTTFQLLQYNKNEMLIRDIYNRQLDAILFSVNQHCWDQFYLWTDALAKIAPQSRGRQKRLELFVDEYEYMTGGFIRRGEDRYTFARRPGENFSGAIDRLEVIIAESGHELAKIYGRAEKGYIQPLIFKWRENRTLLLFPVIMSPSTRYLAGIFIDQDLFVHKVVALKLDQIVDENFMLAVGRKNGEILFLTDENFESEDFEKGETLWILPDLELLIQLSGTTLDQVARAMTRKNLIYLVVMNVFLLAGILLLLKSLMSEIKLAKLKSQFVDNVSHELRTPLALIRMHADLLVLGGVPNEDKKLHYYKLISGESERLTQLVNNVLDFSKIESKRKEYQFAPQDLAGVVDQILDRYAMHLQEKGFELERHVPASCRPVRVDGEAVNQAVINLLENAVKFSDKQKKIIVHVRETDSDVRIIVQDFGLGIPEPLRKRIFEKFYRVDDPFVHDTGGSGLGLSLVRHIMAVHHGRVAVESKPGKGSTFSLIFPQNPMKGT